MKMKAYPVKEFMKFTPSEILDNVKGNVDIVFEDGVVARMKASELVFNRYVWDLVAIGNEMALETARRNRVDAKIMKYNSSYNISNYYKNGYFTDKSLLSVLSTIYRDVINNVFKADDAMTPHNMQQFFSAVYRVVSNLYSSLSFDVSDHVISFNILDLLEVQLDERLIESIHNVRKEGSADSIKTAYDTLDAVIRQPGVYDNNPVKLAYISGLVKINQMLQVLGPRGIVTDIDSSLFALPLASSFTLGMDNIYELAVESRSGAKALHLSTKAIQQSEYLARELQLVAMVVRRVVIGDCGTKRTINWFVKEGDLPNLTGSRYYDPDTGEEKTIVGNEKHLVGQTIRKRSVLKCSLSNKHNVCSACFGDLAYNIPPHAHIGNFSSTVVSSRVSQNLLSTKHLMASALVAAIALDAISAKFFTIKNGNGYALKPEMMSKDNGIKIVINPKECYGLKDIRTKENVADVDPERVTTIESFDVIDGEDHYTVITKNNNRFGVLTPRMLEYIVDNGFMVDERGRYVIDMSRWRSKTPFLEVPEVEYSFEIFSGELRHLFISTKLDSKTKLVTPEGFLSSLFTKVNSKLSINISLLEILVYAFSIYDRESGNYDLSRNSPNPSVASLNNIVAKRSAGAAYGHRALASKIITPQMFEHVNVPDHILDVLICPNEVLSDKGRM